jgi:hypothetical protein
MTKRLLPLAAAALIGCTPTDFLRPTFTEVPPAPAEKTEPVAAKTEAARGRPVTAAQVNERNVRDMVQALDAELEHDTKAVARP